ncbi:MAG: putative O-methyltransferase YrrM [Candidatus Nitrosomirales archaeon]|jgi:predicted O-methyltransferase YrrM
MDHITNEKIEQYIYNLLPESPSILSELEQVAKERHVPIVGPLVGRFLYILARASRANRVLEIGTAIGYSAIWFGLAIKQHKGTVITVEIDKNTANEATRNIARAKLQRTIKVINGSGLQIVPKLKGKFDIVFIDDSKENYPKYLEMCANRLNKNGLLIADNALWSGKVALESKSDDALAIARFNELLAKKMLSVIIPARDGLAIGIK